MEDKNRVIARLDSLGIAYEIVEHPSAATVGDLAGLGIPGGTDICKNLFLRNAQGNRHYLAVLRQDKRADLSALKEQLGCSRLSFASAERLWKYLGVLPGAVTPLALGNDSGKGVSLILDRDLVGAPRLGFHPMENTASVFLDFSSLLTYTDSLGYAPRYVEVGRCE